MIDTTMRPEMPHTPRHPASLLRSGLTCLAGLWLLSAAPVFAQDAPAPAGQTELREKAKQDGFQPVAGAPDTEKVDANKLVIAAYAAFFFGMFGYIVYVARRQSDMAKEMNALAEQIARIEGKG